MITKFFGFMFLAAIIFGCKSNSHKGASEPDSEAWMNIRDAILYEKKNYYYIDFDSCPGQNKTLPIGIFDSGTGGLTVLKAILDYDQNQNVTQTPGCDGLMDFMSESFIYLGDRANMPYGNYANEDNTDLLKEHILKDVQFLMGNKYYSHEENVSPNTDKQPVKIIVIACNTATAYGKDIIEEFIAMAGIQLKVIGVIDAGAKGALEIIGKDEDAIIGVFATAATVESKGYYNAITNLMDKHNYTSDIEVFSQGGVGVAEAVDGDINYYNSELSTPRSDYKGPDLGGDLRIERSLLDAYDFDFTGGKMLCDNEIIDECSVMQINDAENYLRYHLVSLMEKIRISNSENKLRTLILGCTHYPYLTDEITKIFGELYEFRTGDGKYLYREYMAENVVLIDPAINTAKELYDHLNKNAILNPDGDIESSEFYISIPNKHNPDIITDNAGRFTYDYKYGRTAGEIQEYVKVVPFSRKNISDEVMKRIETQMPYIYKLILII